MVIEQKIRTANHPKLKFSDDGQLIILDEDVIAQAVSKFYKGMFTN